MIFIYILIIASVGILVLLFIEQYKTKKTLLQIVKNWCNIDSVLFEEKLENTKKYIVKTTHDFFIFIKKKVMKIVNYVYLCGSKIKSFVRKTLHPQQDKQYSSEFINKMKEK